MGISFKQKVSQWLSGNIIQLAYWRYGLFAALVLVIVTSQLIEHTAKNHQFDIFFLFEMILIIILLVIIVILTETLLIAAESKTQALNILSVKHSLSQQLIAINEWRELTDQLGEFLATLIPETTIALLIPNPSTSFMEIYGCQTPPSITDENGKPLPAMPYCQTCFQWQGGGWYSLQSCLTPNSFFTQDGLAGYCFPIWFGSSQKALLQLCLTNGRSLTPEQLEILDNIRPDLAATLTIIQQRQGLVNQIVHQATDATKREISRDLHDTLGQNLNYLRLKLEQFADDWSEETAETHQDLTRMVEIATESLNLLRGTFITLQSDSHSYLAIMLQDHARLISERADFALQFTSKGTPTPVAPATLRQLLYAYREAFNNIEKHAHANTVTVTINWDATSLLITIKDDGKGFNRPEVAADSHLGLRNMQERMEALGGSIKITSADNLGTQLTINLPLIV